MLFQQNTLTQSASPVAVDALEYKRCSELRELLDSWKTQVGILENRELAVLGGLGAISVSYQFGCKIPLSGTNREERGGSGPTDAPGEHAGGGRDWKSMIDNPVSGQAVGV